MSEKQESDEGSPEGSEVFAIRCRGLPWSASIEEIKGFFSDCKLKNDSLDSIHMTLTREGRPSGEAYIELESEPDVDEALKKDRQHMGKRYVEVFRASGSELNWVVEKSGGGGGRGSRNLPHPEAAKDNVVRLRGLPFDCTKDDILHFFKGLSVTAHGVLLTRDARGRSSGEAFVQFREREHAERALENNKNTIGHRYIEVFRSSMAEARRVSSNTSGEPPYGSGGGPSRYNNYGGGGGGYGGRSMGMRPTPYDRGGNGGPQQHFNNRGFMGGGGGGPPQGRMSRSFKGGYGGYGGDGGPPDDYEPRGRFGGNHNNSAFGRGYNGGYGGPGPRRMERGGYMDDDIGGSPAPLMGRGFGGGMRGGAPSMPPRQGGLVHMRGLPFRVTENDIAEWFSSVVDPVDIMIKYNNDGRPTGEADVVFQTETDAQKAMSKDRQNMQHRYIELFLASDGPPPRGGGY